jgi:hypothetical protein
LCVKKKNKKKERKKKERGEGRICTGRTAYRGSRRIALLFLDHGTRRGCGWGQCHALATLYPRERQRSGTHCTGGWVGPRASLDRCRKSRPQPGFNPKTVQPVTSHYTDWATRPTVVCVMNRKCMISKYI